MWESARQLTWFVVLWMLGVAALALVAGVLRLAMTVAGF
ncbi:MAG: DUF2474 family protein [Alphaproteobacteria bacterium]|nr:DUF2474 family protein [Alphaproteobacteria bacterium]